MALPGRPKMKSMGNPVRIAVVRDHRCQLICDAERQIRLVEQHDAAIRGDPATVEGCVHPLARYIGKSNGRSVSSIIGGLLLDLYVRLPPASESCRIFACQTTAGWLSAPSGVNTSNGGNLSPCSAEQ